MVIAAAMPRAARDVNSALTRAALPRRCVHRLNVLVQNVNGISLRDEEVIATAMKLKADFVLVTETLLHSQRALFRGRFQEYRWLFGLNGAPTASRVRGGVAIAVRHGIGGVHVVHRARDSLWISVPTASGTLFLGVVYLCDSKYKCERDEQLSSVAALTAKLKARGKVVVAGDMNCRMNANGDATTNAEGRKLQAFCKELSLEIVNLTPKCKGAFTFERSADGVLHRSTIDYVLSTPGVVSKMLIKSDATLRSASDHMLTTLPFPVKPSPLHATRISIMPCEAPSNQCLPHRQMRASAKLSHFPPIHWCADLSRGSNKSMLLCG
jgi:hypothetical protein